ncbi:chalcone isomerase family protein [Parvularcula lutaonensis]|uniref:Chalcone isomerase family protein n=1 Tax=Parvularcula lutaonensis TaxID=491923 RepID=A0ABV7M9P0_9PROT|nr:chalcone isomerase family protein [Parvularcula lutaonensis]GGY47183.1 hypothetical protein GCM10007148_15570 [Parvularcula lutaonensis]
MRFLILGVLALYVAATGNALQQAGAAVRTEYFVDLYRITVYDTDGTLTREDINSLRKPLRLTLDVLYDGQLPDIPDTWREELVPAVSDEQMATLRNAYADLKQGDRVVLVYRPHDGTVISVNGTPVVEDDGSELARATFDVWFGKNPVSAEIKADILRG